MRSTSIFKSILQMGLSLALAGGLTTSSNQALAQDGTVQGESAIAEAVGSGFTYQGQLLHEGAPVHGICDFEFGLWDAAIGGTQLDLLFIEGVPVSEGLFSAELDFGSNAFTGDARYLEIGVFCDQGYELLEPRVGLTAAPYAHSLRPGASVQSSAGTALNLTIAATSGAALSANAPSSSGNAAGVYGSSSSAGGAGVSGYNSRSGSGVHGVAGGSTGVPHGVYGLASHTGSATSYGVFGRSNSSAGTGVGGEAPMAGVVGKATASNGTGVYGTASSTDGEGVYGEGSTGVHGHSSDGAGVWGSSQDGWGVSGSSTNDHGVRGGSTNGTGVYGTAASTGTAGIATSPSGETTGVYGKAESLMGRGVYGEGGYHGVYAVGTDPNGVAHGVYGRTESSATGSSGVLGHATSSQGITYGVYGQSNSSSGYGVYSDGPARVEGDLTVAGDLTVLGEIETSTKTSTVSVAPAAFRPETPDINHINEGYYLKYEGYFTDPPQPFYAPLQLPHNATITKLTGCFRTMRELLVDTGLIRMGLERGDLAGGSEEVAKKWPPYVPSLTDFCMSDDAIDYPVIDNDNYIYFVYVYMMKDAMLYGVKVEYEYSAP